jgi:hypothetical protein
MQRQKMRVRKKMESHAINFLSQRKIIDHMMLH